MDYYTFWYKGVASNGIKVSATGSVSAPAGSPFADVWESAKDTIKKQIPGVEPKDSDVSIRKLKRKPR